MKTAVIWTQPNCKYCTLAKQLLLSKGYSYTEKVIGDTYKKKDLLDVIPEARTVPQIILNGTYIGGYEDLVKAL
jgi:glutaredoxin 3